MSIEKITDAIIDEAKTESEQILTAAGQRSRGVITKLEKRIEDEINEAVRSAEKEKERIISRRQSVADIDSKKMILQKKQELISQCFDEAVDYIIGMEEKKYTDFLARLGADSGVKGGELIFNKKERDSIGPEVTAALNRLVEGGAFELSRETGDMKGGYMLRSGQVYFNNTVEAIVEENRQDMMGEVAGLLFSPRE